MFKFNVYIELITEYIELPISNNFDLLSPEEGSITRYANIFEESDDYDSDYELYNTSRDSYSDTHVYSTRRFSGYSDLDNNYYNNYNNNDTHSQKSMTFSDRVIKERQRMIRKKLLSRYNANGSNITNEIYNNLLRPHLAEINFTLSKDDCDLDLYNQILEKHKRIANALSDQKEIIRDIKFNSNRTSATNEKLIQVQLENAKLLSDNQENIETIKNLKIDIENAQSDLIVERKQNEQLLKDKVELQNKISILSKENRSLLTSQEMMQNIHNNEVEELNSKKAELSSRICELQNDLDFFRDSLQESHKMNEILRSEMTSLIDVYKNDKDSLNKLKLENKRLMENNSIYKSQNYSLIEINDRLRKRTLFCNHTGEFSNTNSSTITNLSSDLNLQSTPTAFSPNASHSSYVSESLQDIHAGSDDHVNANANLSVTDVHSLDHSLSAVSPNSNTNSSTSTAIVSNSCHLGLVFNSIDDNSAYIKNNGTLSNMGSPFSCQYNETSDSMGVDANQSYAIANLITNDKIANPTTRWVTEKVSRQSSMDGLESLRDKIRSISLDSNVENVNINGTLKCFQSNVTINLIQNKLQLISQRLNETIV
ncbi:conserved hypothetical protein [Theileria orientalis strain Shintoku]|uniref:Uncharacterized protein n=1 Tax=Theileria orientalis strain Shintoku TaxID=869250 RepID=J4C8K7_THEOR|nr:conserved hypothetical protein [Theileria orientalis strain Shintoku]BAM40958.1 conserved hypothetical protein [Theileria orientalis strain Shintoku]|eukprot:XP_009691259.1 conserved hypothetical protein [Theileria orientalis strain Shintoku]